MKRDRLIEIEKKMQAKWAEVGVDWRNAVRSSFVLADPTEQGLRSECTSQ